MPRQIKVNVPTVDEMMPEDFKKHMLEAYKEFLLAFRSLIDEQVKKIDEIEKGEKRKVIKKIEID
jgi:hypothetical protein